MEQEHGLKANPDNTPVVTGNPSTGVSKAASTVYEIYLPAADLRPFIECYWFLKAIVRPPHQLEEMIFTDARADIVFVYSSPYLRTASGQRAASTQNTMRTSNLDAPRPYPVYIHQQGTIDLVGVRFRPGGLAPFVRVPVHELSGWTLSLLDAFGPHGVELEGKLFDASGHRPTQVALLDQFFRRRMVLHRAYHQVKHWMDVIEQHRGLIAISRLSEACGYSIRSVDRLFQQFVGLSPKFFARTVRFRYVHRHLMRNPESDWQDIVAFYGYVDQSHFAKDILSLTGAAPKVYRAFLRRQRDSLPPNFVHFLQDT